MTSAAGSNHSVMRQTGNLTRIVTYCAERARVHYRNCLGELPAGAGDALLDKDGERYQFAISLGWLTECGVSMALSLMIPKTLWLHKNKNEKKSSGG